MIVVENRYSYQLKQESSFLKTLAYFDIFDYPVTSEEIFCFLDQSISNKDLHETLDSLHRRGIIFQLGEFYSLRNDPTLLTRRQNGNNRARPLLERAYRIAAFLYKFPYVRGVCISGSLSKNFAEESADIDFFVITKSNRLWIARTIMHIYKKLTFLTGRQNYYCMNYYVDEQGLQIEEKNIYAAVEISTLMPVCGTKAVPGFFAENNWVHDYFPNYSIQKKFIRQAKGSWLKRAVEFVLNYPLFNQLDDYLLRLTTKRWKKKEERTRLNIHGMPLSLKTGKHFSKPNPIYFQGKILKLYEAKVSSILK